MSTEQPEHDPATGHLEQTAPPEEPAYAAVHRNGGGRSGQAAPPSSTGGPYGEPPGSSPPPSSGSSGPDSPYGSPPPPPSGEPPRYGGGPYDSNPYGDEGGAADPLAGMPPLANRGKRLLARIIDALLIGIPVGLVLGLTMGGQNANGGGNGPTYTQEGIYTIVYLIYEGWMLSRTGQTVGKKLMKIRVAMLANGDAPRGAMGWFRAAVYQVPLLVPCIGFIFWLVNVLFCTWDKPYQQCLHDKAVRTVVVEAEGQ
jgi:uncharacterized RDD family membrane protein YckC